MSITVLLRILASELVDIFSLTQQTPHLTHIQPHMAHPTNPRFHAHPTLYLMLSYAK